jgi:hypothetical protein
MNEQIAKDKEISIHDVSAVMDWLKENNYVVIARPHGIEYIVPIPLAVRRGISVISNQTKDLDA